MADKKKTLDKVKRFPRPKQSDIRAAYETIIDQLHNIQGVEKEDSESKKIEDAINSLLLKMSPSDPEFKGLQDQLTTMQTTRNRASDAESLREYLKAQRDLLIETHPGHLAIRNPETTINRALTSPSEQHLPIQEYQGENINGHDIIFPSHMPETDRNIYRAHLAKYLSGFDPQYFNFMANDIKVPIDKYLRIEFQGKEKNKEEEVKKAVANNLAEHIYYNSSVPGELGGSSLDELVKNPGEYGKFLNEDTKGLNKKSKTPTLDKLKEMTLDFLTAHHNRISKQDLISEGKPITIEEHAPIFAGREKNKAIAKLFLNGLKHMVIDPRNIEGSYTAKEKRTAIHIDKPNTSGKRIYKLDRYKEED